MQNPNDPPPSPLWSFAVFAHLWSVVSCCLLKAQEPAFAVQIAGPLVASFVHLGRMGCEGLRLGCLEFSEALKGRFLWTQVLSGSKVGSNKGNNQVHIADRKLKGV